MWTNIFPPTFCRYPLLYNCLIWTQACFWPDETLKVKAGAGEESWNIPGSPDIYYVRAVVELLSRGQKLLVAPLWVVTAALCLCWFIPHLPIVQKTKGYLSPEALLWYISKCQFHNLAGEKKKIPLWLLRCSSTCYCHTKIQPKVPPGTRLHTSPSVLGNWHREPC